jgi:hypothetical protein
MKIPKTDLCDPKCCMCYLNGECVFKKQMENLMKAFPECKPGFPIIPKYDGEIASK